MPAPIATTPPLARRGFPSRLIGAFFVILGSLVVVTTAAQSPARAANLTVTGTSTGAWSASGAGTNTYPVTISGTTVGDAQSIRVSFASGNFSLPSSTFTVGPCPSWMTATIGATAAECYWSGAMVSLSLPGSATISGGSAFSAEYAAGTITANNPVTGTMRDVTVGTYAGNHFSSSLVDSGTTTLTWPATVTFNANGGTGTMAPQTSSTAQNLTANAFTKAGLTFAGWAQFWGGGPQAYADGASYPFTQDETLYARWEATVTFDANGGTGTMAPQVAASSTQLTANSFTRTGHTFVGWNTNAASMMIEYMDGQPYNFGASTTLYAVWQAQQGQTTTTTTAPTTTTPNNTAPNTTSPNTTPPAGSATPPPPPSATDNGTSASATTTTSPAGVQPVEAPAPDARPSLVSADDAPQMQQQPGRGGATVDGEPVTATVVTADGEAADVPAEQRTPEQVAALQESGRQLVTAFNAAAPDGAAPLVTITNTDTGAVVTGVAVDPADGTTDVPVPVEDVVLLSTAETKVLFAAVTPGGEPEDVTGGVLQLSSTGGVSVLAYGLPQGETGELVLFSTPTLLATFTAGSDGSLAAQMHVPAGLAPGSHTLVLAAGGVTASLGLHVDAAGTTQIVTPDTAVRPPSGVLPSTGGDQNSWVLLFAAASIILGTVLVVKRPTRLPVSR